MLDFLLEYIKGSFNIVQLDFFAISFLSFLSIWALMFIFKIVWGR